MAKNPIGFSKKVFGYTQKYDYNKQILNAVKSSPLLRHEIAQVFQAANRRIQNIEKAGLISPAVAALNKGDITGFTKFSMKLDWDDLKIEYAKAVSFLKQPTSTASGTRQYNEHLKSSYELTDEEFKLIEDKLKNKIASVSDERFLEQYLLQYKDFTGELETEVKDVADQIESEAMVIEKVLENDLNQKSMKAADEVESAVSAILANFAKFGL